LRERKEREEAEEKEDFRAKQNNKKNIGSRNRCSSVLGFRVYPCPFQDRMRKSDLVQPMRAKKEIS
jgi:hypothetical protein